jgi:hypothetical protein
MPIEFKYQTLFTCSVPTGYTAIKDFNEMIASDAPQTTDTLLQIIRMSFENSGVDVKSLEMSHDLMHCDALLNDEKSPIRIIIRQRPSLVVDGVIYKLEEFDI